MGQTIYNLNFINESKIETVTHTKNSKNNFLSSYPIK